MQEETHGKLRSGNRENSNRLETVERNKRIADLCENFRSGHISHAEYLREILLIYCCFLYVASLSCQTTKYSSTRHRTLTNASWRRTITFFADQNPELKLRGQ